MSALIFPLILALSMQPDSVALREVHACAEDAAKCVDLPPTAADNSQSASPAPSRDAVLTERVRKLREILDAPRPRNASAILYAELEKFRGMPPQFAFNRLGYPDKKMNVEGAIVYSWLYENSNLDGSDLRCTVKVVVRFAKIVRTEFYGNGGACVHFAKALDASFTGEY